MYIFLYIDVSEVSVVGIFKIFRSGSKDSEENKDAESSVPKKLETNLEKPIEHIKFEDSDLGGQKLLSWLLARMESPEMIEANNNLEDITLQFNVGGILFYMTKSGVQSFQIISGRCSDPDVLIRIPLEVESKLASMNDFTEFFQEYKKYAKSSGGDEYINIKYMKDLSQLSKKGILRSKLVRTLLMA